MSQPGSQTDKALSDGGSRAMVCWIGLTALLLLALMAGPWLCGKVYTRDDLGAFHLPVRAFYAEQLARAEPFDWMPQLYCGFYLTGEGQAGTYHPLHWALYRFLPLATAAGLEWLASYPWMFVGTWLWLRRRLGRSDAAAFGALLFTFCGFNLLHFLHPNAVAVVAHLPWLLWAIDVALLDARPRRATAALGGIALLTGSQLLLGYPQYVWFSLLAELGYAAFLLVVGRSATPSHASVGRSATPSHASVGRSATPSHASVGRSATPSHESARAPRWPWLLMAKGCGLLLGGVQLLPTLDSLLYSVRGAPDPAFAHYGSLSPLNLFQLVAPYFFAGRVLGGNTHELSVYAGSVPLVLLVWLLIRRKGLGRLGRPAAAVGLLATAALLMALGKYGVFYRLQAALPLVDRFRFPCRYLVLFQLALAVLGAIGFAVLLDDCRRAALARRRGYSLPVKPSLAPLWAVIGLAAAVAGVGAALQANPHVAGLGPVLAGPALLAAAAVLVTLATRGFRVALVALVFLAAADLGFYGLSYAVYPGTRELDELIAETPTPPATPQGRVLAGAWCLDGRGYRTGNEIVLAGWRRADGYAGLDPRKRLDYGRLPALRVAGVRWVTRESRTESIAGLIPCGPGWLEVPQPLDRVRLAGRVEAGDEPMADEVGPLGDASGKLARLPLESAALAEFPLALPPGPPGRVRVLVDRPGRLRIRCDCPSPKLLVVAESYHPGWQARVDEEPRQVFRVNGDFIGCVVGPGLEQVELEFRPPSLKRGRLATWAGLGLLGCCLVCFGRRPRTPEEDKP